MKSKIMKLLAGGAVVLSVCATQAFAQTNSNQVSVALSANILSQMTISVASPTQAFGSVQPGSTTAAQTTLTVKSGWLLVLGQTVTLDAYFGSASAAMVGTATGDDIPVSAFTGSVNGGSAAAFSQTNPFGGSLALQMYSYTPPLAGLIGGRNDTIQLNMNLNGLTLGPDNYTGTMYLQAQAL